MLMLKRLTQNRPGVSLVLSYVFKCEERSSLPS